MRKGGRRRGRHSEAERTLYNMSTHTEHTHIHTNTHSCTQALSSRTLVRVSTHISPPVVQTTPCNQFLFNPALKCVHMGSIHRGTQPPRRWPSHLSPSGSSRNAYGEKRMPSTLKGKHSLLTVNLAKNNHSYNPHGDCVDEPQHLLNIRQ